MAATVPQCRSDEGGLQLPDFRPISENGFDAADHAQDQNDYPWSMSWYAPAGSAGHLYVGTGNGIDDQAFYELGLLPFDGPPRFPAEIRRHRPDLGANQWETVFDVRDVENGPPYATNGVRGLAPFSTAAGQQYLYAGTFGNTPSLWRSPSGNPGTWEEVFAIPEYGSIRALTQHDDLLYFARAGVGLGFGPQEEGAAVLYATDGTEVWTVVDDGFGNPDNSSIWGLASFNGFLYVGTYNPVTGYEVWKMAGPDSTPVRIVNQGGPSMQNTAAGTMHVFKEQLYVGSLVFSSKNEVSEETLKGPDLIRISADDSWEVLVGRNSIGGIGSGFDAIGNSYLWSMASLDGWLYAGTWGFTTDILVSLDRFPEILQNLPQFLLDLIFDANQVKRDANVLTISLQIGGDLYKSPDGVTWYPITQSGLGDPYNYGVRAMEAVDDTLYVGMANPFDGLEMWAGRLSR
jgi:hypothetical protein